MSLMHVLYVQIYISSAWTPCLYTIVDPTLAVQLSTISSVQGLKIHCGDTSILIISRTTLQEWHRSSRHRGARFLYDSRTEISESALCIFAHPERQHKERATARPLRIWPCCFHKHTTLSRVRVSVGAMLKLNS